jgi:hypothetical protein
LYCRRSDMIRQGVAADLGRRTATRRLTHVRRERRQYREAAVKCQRQPRGPGSKFSSGCYVYNARGSRSGSRITPEGPGRGFRRPPAAMGVSKCCSGGGWRAALVRVRTEVSAISAARVGETLSAGGMTVAMRSAENGPNIGQR